MKLTFTWKKLGQLAKKYLLPLALERLLAKVEKPSDKG